MFQPLSNLLLAGVRFLLLPLPPREFRPCYLRLTKSYRPLLDAVGLTLLCHLVFQYPLGAIYSAVEMLFTRLTETSPIRPIHLPFWLEPISLIWLLNE